MHRRGFTLVELVLVMAIIGAFSVFAAEKIQSAMQSTKFAAAVDKVASDIRYAQQLARTHNGWYGIQFSPTTQYKVYATDGATDTTVADPVNPAQVLQINVSTSYGGVAISAVNIAGGNKVEFNPTGTPYDDKNGAALAANGTVTLALGGNTKIITITKNTGRVVVP